MPDDLIGRLQAMLVEKDRTIAQLQESIKTTAKQHKREIEKNRDYYENILALMPGHVYWLDRNNVYLGCNDIQARQAGLSSRRKIIGKRNRDLPWKKQADELDQLNTQVMETGVADATIESAVMANGDGMYFSQKVPLRDEHDAVIGLLGISIDITELKKTERELTAAKEVAEAANRAKIEFIANMSHDIRTPLSGVVGMSKLLEDSLTYPEHKQYAQWINQSGEQLLSLLNGILDVVSSENINKGDLRDDVFDLRQCINEIVQLERPTTQLKKIDLIVAVDELAPHYIVSDRANLHRVLLNLLGNAIKFTQSGHVAIEVDVLAHNEDHANLQFRVVDTGIGIPQEHQAHVFERFFRASSSYDGVYAGYGVGLHIAKSSVELLGGELKLTSEVGVGTTFYFDLSLNIGRAEQLTTPATTHSIAQRVGGLLDDQPRLTTPPFLAHNVPHVLLVEDNMIALRMIELIITQAGCHFTSAVNGEYALELIKSIDFDLVVTDVGLPGFSGYELTRRIREWETLLLKNAVPIVGVTAHMQQHVKNQCLQSGMNDVFCKPVNLQIMQSIINRYVSTAIKGNNVTVGRIDHDIGYTTPDIERRFFDLGKFQLLDVEHSVQRLGSESLLREMLQLMVQQEIPNDLDAIQKAHANNDWDAVEKIAHKMKGGAVYCGTFRMQHACQYLERYRKAGYSASLEQLYQQLLHVLHETQQEIWRILR